MTEFRVADLDRELDHVLGRALQPPEVPRDFRRRVHAALSRTTETDLESLRERFEDERRRQLQALEADYVRIRRGTLGTLIGVAFVAGVAATIAMPWLRAHLGIYAPIAIAWGAVALGLAMVSLEPLRELLQQGSDIGRSPGGDSRAAQLDSARIPASTPSQRNGSFGI